MKLNQLSEQKVLKKLGIEDFRHLTKAKVIKLASMLDRMEPEVAKKALEQFPEFSKTAREILSEYKDVLDKGMETNDSSIKAVYDTYSTIMESLQKEWEKEDLSFEEKKYIMEQMKYVADKMDKKDTENKKWILSMVAIGGMVAASTMAVLASALGGNTQMDVVDFDDSQA